MFWSDGDIIDLGRESIGRPDKYVVERGSLLLFPIL